MILYENNTNNNNDTKITITLILSILSMNVMEIVGAWVHTRSGLLVLGFDHPVNC